MPETHPLPVAVVMTSFDSGGTEHQMIELVRRLDRRRWTVHLACLHARGPWLPRALDAAGTVTEFPFTGFKKPEACRQALAFARWCTRNRIEVVHAVDFYTNIFALPAAAFARVPVRIGSRRGHNRDRSPAQLAMQRAALSCAHVIVANSHAIAEHLTREHIRPDRVAVVANGVAVEAFHPVPPRTRRRRVIVVANLRPEKGYDVLIDAATDVLRRFSDATFDLVGAGPEQTSLQERIAARGLTHAFRFLGQRGDVPDLLAEADIFVLPSRNESLPNAVLEAMAAGLPVVASAVGGVPEIIDDGRTGLLWPAGNAAALADRLALLMHDSSLGARLGAAARQDVQTRFSFERMVTDMDRLYVRELARRGRLQAEMAA